MEQYFSKQVNNCFHLNFTNRVFKTNKIASFQKNLHQKAIHFTKKPEKKSLKRVFFDRVLEIRKNASKQMQPFSIKQTPKEIQSYEVDDYGNKASTPIKVNNQNKNLNKQYPSAYDLKERLHKSLQRQQIRKHVPQRNMVEQLKSYRNKGLPVTTQPPRIQFIRPTVSQSINFTGNLRQTFTAVGSNFPSQQINRLSHSGSIRQQYFQPVYRDQFYKDQTRVYPSNQFLQKTPIKTVQYSQTQFIAKPPVIHPNFHTYSDNFRKIYGEIQLEEQIKKDLMTSMEMHKFDTLIDNRPNRYSFFNKSPPSEGSTMISSESKLKKRFNQGENFDNQNYQKKIRTQKCMKVQNSNLFVDSAEFKQKCQRREIFKSIVSVNSEHSSTQSVSSIIIEKHPQKIVSSKPIKTLL